MPGSGGMAHDEVGDRLAADFARVQHLDLPAHLPQHVDQAGAGRVEADVLDRQFAARHDQRGDDEEGGGGGVARHDDVLRLQVGLAADGDDPLAEIVCHLELGAEAPEHALGVVAGRHRLDHRVIPAVLSPASSTALLTCAEATGRRYVDRHGGGDAAHGQREAAAFARLEIRRRSARAGRSPGPSAVSTGWHRR